MANEIIEADAMRDEEFKGIWRLLQNDMSMPSDVPSSMPTQNAPVPIAPTSTSAPTQSPIVVRTEAPIIVAPVATPTASPTTTNITNIPTRVPSQNSSSAPIGDISPAPTSLETEAPFTPDPEIGSDIPSDLPSDIPSLMPFPQVPSPMDPTEPSMPPTFPCGSSPDLRELLMKVPLLGISDEEALDTEGTPQNEAFQWIVGGDPSYLCPNDPMLSQRYSLAVFYYSTNGNRWTQCEAPVDASDEAQVEEANQRCDLEPLPDSGSNAWLTPGSECDWAGVVCNDDGIIEQLDMEQNGLAGTLPSELQHLSALKVLSLENGVISGVIPSEIGALTALEVLDLNFNLIGGSIPSSIYTLSTLRQLDLNDNALTGILSSEIGNMGNLTFLQIHQNQFEGTFPSALGRLSLLEAASFESNTFEGSIPASVCSLASDGPLASLSSDCLTEVECSCCTQCF
ncbi:hypothetical protein FisN_15Hh136 [Fistulifera solaris]|uniref:Leucine-rich repeat-containing N-terminal plant-type domain-containing protein n=1 Tax=Fistulifera solaris TaxID=1519565 RepID=A0A1Z5K9L9_FISSO|nr:hypothetical protein FisN_15Hh136 [Fistulifera solaris]|eukprot:GAX22969.1 hypothetical protein FisN_15Hh136 [Fistulifera solaris]